MSLDHYDVSLYLTGKKEKTEYIDNNLDPEWNETIEYSLDEALATTDNLEVEVFDHERVGSHRYRECVYVPGLL